MTFLLEVTLVISRESFIKNQWPEILTSVVFICKLKDANLVDALHETVDAVLHMDHDTRARVDHCKIIEHILKADRLILICRDADFLRIIHRSKLAPLCSAKS